MDERALASIREYEMRRASLVKQKKTALVLLEQCKSLGLTVGETKGALSYAGNLVDSAVRRSAVTSLCIHPTAEKDAHMPEDRNET